MSFLFPTNKSTTLAYIYVTSVVAAAQQNKTESIAAFLQETSNTRSYTICRDQILFEQIKHQLLDYYFCWLCRMNIPIFDSLLCALAPYLPNGDLAINGKIYKATRLSIALCYLSGGDLYDIMLTHGMSHRTIFDSLWSVIDAIHQCDQLNIK